jgi:two-component system capsular synthesis response regulator RcsB
MIDKVIIAEDHESSNLSVQNTMDVLNIQESHYVFYCDDALNKIKMAKHADVPYDVLITDLLFEDDGTSQNIKDGYALIQSVREFQPDIRILVFSGEDRPTVISKLYEVYEIDGYVRKARHDVKELKAAFEAFSKRQKYYPHGYNQLTRKTNSYDFSESDMLIIRLLSQGYRQKEIEFYLKKNKIEPSSLSWIEKKLKEIRDEFGFTKNEQLVLFCKEAGVL